MTSKTEIKKYIASKYMRVNPQAFSALLQAQEAHTTALIDEAITRAQDAGRKSIFAEDIETKPDSNAPGVEIMEG